MKARIFGAGSIGNHLSFALRSLKIDVEVVDIDKDALLRMKNSIYPSRYGTWDSNINLSLSPSDNLVDLEIIGTPPDTHADILKERIKKDKSRIWLVEKPFIVPDNNLCDELSDFIEKSNAKVFCGYNHSLSPAFQSLVEHLKSDNEIKLIDAYWLEHWGGIFNAHPWLEGPSSSYLGYSRRGGGAFMEHSHGIHLALALCNIKNDFRDFSFPKLISSNSIFDISESYDQSSQLVFEDFEGTIIRYTTDVLTKNVNKSIRVETSKALYQLSFAVNNGQSDSLRIISKDKEKNLNYPRSRRLDFEHEVKFLKNCLIKKDFSNLSIIDWRLALHISRIGNQILN
ncbi:MAG: hypothetical protein CMD05_03840 [Flavobacteriales bacterium]|nr:hypothetical protein [Flavobacteriales bacterium]